MKSNKGIAVALAAVILTSGVEVTGGVVTAAPAQAAATQTQVDAAINQILTATNAERVRIGLAPLKMAQPINSVAQKWSAQQASESLMYHNPTYASQMPRGWSRAAENVAYGYSVSSVTSAWMNSPGHRANILGDFTHIGIGYELDANGQPYYTQNFAKYPVVTAPTIPNAPTVSGVGMNQFSLNWTPKWDETVTHYKVELLSGNTVVETRTVTGGSAAFTGLTTGAGYTVKITAVAIDALGATFTSPVRSVDVRTLANPAPAAAPNAPTQLTATVPYYSTATLSWAAPTGILGNLTGYTVTVKESGKADRVLNTTGTSLTLNGLTENTNYSVQVVANVVATDGGNTAKSPAANLTVKTPWSSSTVKVTAPTGLKSFGVIHDEAQISWTAPTGTVGKISSYTVKVLKNNVLQYTEYVTGTTHQLTRLSANSSYTVQVFANAASADNTRLASSPAATHGFRTPESPSAVWVNTPTGLKSSAITENSFTASWLAPTGTVGKLTEYEVTVKQGTRVIKTQTIAPTSLSYKVAGLAANTAYTVEVSATALSADGTYMNFSPQAAKLNVTTAKSSIVKVVAPAVTVSTKSDRVTATWKKPAVTGTVTGYVVTVKQGTKVVKTQKVAATGLSATVTGLRENTAYSVVVEVAAVSPNGAKIAKASVTKNVKTPLSAASTVKVGKPASVTASTARTSLTVAWKKPYLYGKLQSYTVVVKQGSKTVKSYSTTSTKRTITGLRANTTYTVYVKANAVSANGKYKASSAYVSKVVKTKR